MPNLVKETIFLRDATTGENVSVIVTESGKLYEIEGLDYELIQQARIAVARINRCSISSSPIQLEK